jgi:hypothetical protein
MCVVILSHLMMCLIYIILVTLLVIRIGMYKMNLPLCMFVIILITALSL